jgi:hypothetical protein
MSDQTRETVLHIVISAQWAVFVFAALFGFAEMMTGESFRVPQTSAGYILAVLLFVEARARK